MFPVRSMARKKRICFTPVSNARSTVDNTEATSAAFRTYCQESLPSKPQGVKSSSNCRTAVLVSLNE